MDTGLYFHTIKSILNQSNKSNQSINQLNFHTIKSILNLVQLITDI